MKKLTIITAAVLCITIIGIGDLMARPRPERVGLPASNIGIPWDDPCSHDDSLHIYDITHYDIHVDIDITNQLIYGDVSIRCYSTDNSLDEILLELKSLTVDSVEVDGIETVFDYHSDSLFVPLPAPLPEGDSVLVRVVYYGHPQHETWGGFWFQSQRAYTLGDGLYVYPPPYNHTWFPNWRHPADRSMADLWFTIPDDKVAASNGELIEIIENIPQQTVTYHWKQHEPISSYLYCVAVADYLILEDTYYDWIENYIYPSHQSQAQVSLSNVHLMMDAYQDLFGPYPFQGKFGYAMTGGGDMEHAGLVAHVAGAVNGLHNYDWLLAHEMSHMWWGDMVTCGTWKDLWLNEGFATYCEALFHEHAYGEESYRNYVWNSLMSVYFNSYELFPIYDPVNLWTETVYEKGGCVMHMLRHVIGDSLFFTGWNEYGDRYRWDTAITEEFQEVMEEISSQDLDWFFDEWIYGPGYPRYNYSWHALPSGGDWEVFLWVDQIQTSGGPFTMPIDFAVISSVDTIIQTVWVNSDPFETSFISGTNEPVNVEFDYHNWVLETHIEIPSTVPEVSAVPLAYSLKPAFPNPFNSSTVIQYSMPNTSRIALSVFNVLGQKVITLAEGSIHAGEYSAQWDGKDEFGNDVSSGLYLIGMNTPGYQQVTKVILLR